MVEVPTQLQSLVPAIFAIRTVFEVFRHPSPVRFSVLLTALVVVVYFGVDPVAVFGWTFNETAFGAEYIKAAFNAVLLGGATMDGHDLLKRVRGG